MPRARAPRTDTSPPPSIHGAHQPAAEHGPTDAGQQREPRARPPATRTQTLRTSGPPPPGWPGRGAAGGATPPAVRAERKERGSGEATAGESGGAAGDDNTRGRASESCADGLGEERRGPRDDESWSWLPKDRHSRSADSGAGGAAAGVTGESERERRRKAGEGGESDIASAGSGGGQGGHRRRSGRLGGRQSVC